MRTPFRRAAAVLAAAVFVLAACGGDDDTTDATDGSTTTMAGDMGDGDDHSHGGIDVSGWAAIPTLAIEATPDAVAGVNVHIETTDFTFAPENASTASVEREGHAHIYVDGEKVSRVYGDWYHLSGLTPGDHDITVDLNGNDHSTLMLDDEAIADTVTVTVPETTMDHMHMEGREAAAPAPTVTLEVIEDPKAGYNLHVETTDFSFAPEQASGDAVDGEGHAHLYVDGAKVARLYTSWYHLGALDPGEHEIRVELNGNDHVALLSGGEAIEAVETIRVEGDAPAPADAAVIEVSVANGAVEGGGRHAVALGDTVTLRVTSDVADEVHLHGYDVTVDVGAGETVDLTFDATIPGVFEVELEDTRLQILELEVS